MVVEPTPTGGVGDIWRGSDYVDGVITIEGVLLAYVQKTTKPHKKFETGLKLSPLTPTWPTHSSSGSELLGRATTAVPTRSEPPHPCSCKL